MWPNSQKTADLVKFTEEIFKRKQPNQKDFTTETTKYFFLIYLYAGKINHNW